MPYRVSDQEHYIRCLRTFAVLLQRRGEVEVQSHGWNHDRGRFRITFDVDERLFWQTFRELHDD